MKQKTPLFLSLLLLSLLNLNAYSLDARNKSVVTTNHKTMCKGAVVCGSFTTNDPKEYEKFKNEVKMKYSIGPANNKADGVLDLTGASSATKNKEGKVNEYIYLESQHHAVIETRDKPRIYHQIIRLWCENADHVEEKDIPLGPNSVYDDFSYLYVVVQVGTPGFYPIYARTDVLGYQNVDYSSAAKLTINP
jgi:hypothetical protein